MRFRLNAEQQAAGAWVLLTTLIIFTAQAFVLLIIIIHQIKDKLCKIMFCI